MPSLASLRRFLAPDSARPDRSSPGLRLAVILGAYLMIVLDFSIVITALPDIQRTLHFSASSLSWIQSTYALTFSGLLLLGARAGDILGRRRVFMAGIALFTAMSLLAGLAQSPAELLVARAFQGVGAAIAAPSTLALLTVGFREGRERTRALAYYAAVASGGGSVGLVLGGALTQWVSWRWGLFVNVPVGLALLWLAPRHLPETERRGGHFDVAGAITSTLGMSSLVYGFVRASSDGWGDRWTIASFVVSAMLLAAFVANERRARQPITPLRLFASRQRSGALVARVLVVSGVYAMFFFLTQYLQGSRGFTPLAAGTAFLPSTIAVFAMAQVVPKLVSRFGTTTLLAAGLPVSVVGMAWLSRLDVDTPFVPGIALPLTLVGLGMGTIFAPLTSAGVADVAEDDAGAASGLVNAAHQLGGSLGVSVLITVFTSASHGAPSDPTALAHAVAMTVTGSAALLALGLAVVVFVMLRPRAILGRVVSLVNAS